MPAYTTLATATLIGVAAITLVEAQGRSSIALPERGDAPSASSPGSQPAPTLDSTPPSEAATVAPPTAAGDAPRVAIRTIRASLANRRLDPVRSCDLDGDGRVDAADVDLVRAAMGTRNAAADVTGDSLVDERDLGAVLAAWSR